MLYSGTDPESYITEYTLVYADNTRTFWSPFLLQVHLKSMSLKYEPASEPFLQVQRKAADDEKKHTSPPRNRCTFL